MAAELARADIWQAMVSDRLRELTGYARGSAPCLNERTFDAQSFNNTFIFPLSSPVGDKWYDKTKNPSNGIGKVNILLAE